MTGDNDRPEKTHDFASSPCMMHEFEDSETASQIEPSREWAAVARWRSAERKRQLEKRLALVPELRRHYADQISEHLESALGDVAGLTVSFYWPIRGEPDLRGLMERITQRGGHCALPVVVERGSELASRWRKSIRFARSHTIYRWMR